MQNLNLPRMKITIQHFEKKKPLGEPTVYEGEAKMSQEQQDYFKSIIGDGNAGFSIGRDLSMMEFGNGGKIFVSVSLKTDQSRLGLWDGARLAYMLATQTLEEFYPQVKQDLINKGLIKP